MRAKRYVLEDNKLFFKFIWKVKDKVKRLDVINDLDKGESTPFRINKKPKNYVTNLPRINKVIGRLSFPIT